MPQLGELVLGGGGKPGERLNTAEILETGVKNVANWREICPMIKARDNPSGVYFEGSVIVASEKTVEMLSLPSGQPGQWTIIFTIPSQIPRFICMCVFNGDILIAGELIEMN